MRRGYLFLLALLSCVAAIPAHAQIVPQTAATALNPLAVEDVLSRVMEFDRDGNGKVAKAELAERMQPLVARGDVDGNEALDVGEIRALAKASRKPLVHSGTYGFANREELSSRSHIENTLDDLRLGQARKDQAREIALDYMKRLEAEATTDLMYAFQDLLTAEQLARVRESIEQRLRVEGPGVRGRVVMHEELVKQIGQAGRAAPVFMPVPGPKLEALIETLIPSHRLPAAQSQRVQAALQRFRTRLKLGSDERSQLLAALKGTLNDEEAENFAAAIARRPVVQSGIVVEGVTTLAR